MSSLLKAKRLLNLAIALLLFHQVVQSQSVRFTDTSYINLGNHASLKLTNFTLEAWVRIEGYGSTTETGSGGISGVVPIITKGRAEAEAAAVDVNYFLGYNLSTMRLVADFEDDATSANHPVTSTGAAGVLSMCTWTHVAVSYNTSTDTWKMYINGALNTTSALGANFTPRSASDVAACIGSSLNTGTSIRPGFFNGRIDEVRIWNVVRTDAEITASFNAELVSGTGLAGRWGLNENSGTTANNSIGGGATGTLTNSPLWVTGFNQADPTSNASIDLNGVHDYISFGIADGSAGNPSLNVSPNFSLEAWVKREGTGTTASTGTGGVTAVPILAKGRGEGESPNNLNMNYFLGIDANGKLVADFEETTGPNHPVASVASVPLNVWTHVAATFNNTTRTWKLFFNGTLDITEGEAAGNPPANNSIQHASIGTAMNSSGVTEGLFNGKIDEVRIWNVTRTDAEISTNYNAELISGAGLVARWGFNQNCGLTAVNSVAGGSTGVIRSNNIATHPTNGGPHWVSGYTSLAPNLPVNPSPSNNGTASSTSPTLCADVSDPNAGTMRVRYYGRKKPGASSKFTIIWLPDTQYYVEEPPAHGGTPAMFNSQTAWIVNNRATKNIVYVGQLGDCTEHGDAQPVEWTRASTAMYVLENPGTTGLPQGIPYGVCVGNHDQSPIGIPTGTTTQYNNTFGITHFTGKSYYGGHNGSNNDNHYQLFTANGTQYMVISFEYDQTADFSNTGGALDWAEGLVVANPAKKIILMTHYMIDESAVFGTQGQAIYNRLGVYPNVFLLVGGHIHTATGEGQRTDTYNGNTIHTVLSDYQGRTNGGNGLLRIFEFRPATNDIFVQTYSPFTNTYETDANSEFSLPYTMAPFTLIGEIQNVTSGTRPCQPWAGLDQFTDYEWYMELFDGENTTTGPVWTFTTPAGSPLPVSLIDFTATPESRRVRLNWSTATEINNDHFDIERSENGSLFYKIGEVPGSGNTFSTRDYLYYDNSPVKGKTYYRLKQVDINNRFDYSSIAPVKYGDNLKVEVFPNPTQGSDINLYFNESIRAVVSVMIFDMSGQQVYWRELQEPHGIIRLKPALPKGVYLLTISSDEINITKKIIVGSD